MIYKQALLRDIILTYTQAEEVRLYEDRSKQYVDQYYASNTRYHIDIPLTISISVMGFRRFFSKMNNNLLAMNENGPRPVLDAEVIEVMEALVGNNPPSCLSQDTEGLN